MLFHLSIAARDPQHVASVIAELWGGEVHPCAPVSGGWGAYARDERGTLIDVYPLDIVLREPQGDAIAHGERVLDETEVDVDCVAHGEPAGFTATHAAIATNLARDEVMAIAAREGWPAKYCKRAGLFGVIELWIEGRQMIEVLTPEMQAEYLAIMSRPGAPTDAAQVQG